MKKLFYFLLALPLLCTSCSKDDDKVLPDVETIEISQYPTTMKIGDSFTLKATHSPTEAASPVFIWKSSDEKKAIIDGNGKMTALANGEVTITVSAKIKQKGVAKELTASTLVKITSTGIEGIRLSQEQLVIENGKTSTLTIVFVPSHAAPQQIIWTSNNTSVSTVADGLVKALKVGEATITATVKGTSIQATCKVVVTDAQLTGIQFKNSPFELVMGEKKATEVVHIPEQAVVGQVVYKSLDLSVASVDENGVITALGEGKTKIEATTEKGFKATCDVEVVHFVKRIFVSKSGNLIDVGGNITGDAVFTINNQCGKEIEIRKFVIVDRNGKTTYLKEINESHANNSKFEVSYKFLNVFAPSYAFIVQIDQKEYKFDVQ